MIHLDNLLDATKGRRAGPTYARHFTDFCFDSRRIEPGQIFLAIKTAKGDGHDHIQEAIEGGATGILYRWEWQLGRRCWLERPPLRMRGSC